MTDDTSTSQVVKSEPTIQHISKFFCGDGNDLTTLNIYCTDQASAFEALASLQPDDLKIRPVQLKTR